MKRAALLKVGSVLLILGLIVYDQVRQWHAERGPQVFSGTLELTEHSLGARVAGRLASVVVEEGDTVNRGDLIATLDRYEQARRDYDRAAELLQNGGSTRQALEEAQLALNDQRVVSPVNGTVLTKVHDAGEVVSSGSPVVIVGDRSRLWVRIYIPQSLINRVRREQPARIRVDGIDRAFPGAVTFVSPQAEFTPRNIQTKEERITQTFAVKVELADPPEFLRPGVAADVEMQFAG